MDTEREAAAMHDAIVDRDRRILVLEAELAELRRGRRVVCEVCWSDSWEPCPEGTPGAVWFGDEGDGYMRCGLCHATSQLAQAAYSALLAARAQASVALAAPQEVCQHPNAVVAADTRGGAARWCSDCLTYPQEAQMTAAPANAVYAPDGSWHVHGFLEPPAEDTTTLSRPRLVPPNPEAERVLDALDAEVRASVGLDGETQEIEEDQG